MTLLRVAALCMPLLAMPVGVSAKRLAILVSSNTGAGQDLPLRHTSNDSSRMADVLIDLGQFARRDVHLLQHATLADLQQSLEAARPDEPAEMLVFYYSGHAEAGALKIAGQELAITDLMAVLDKIQSHLRIVIIDACQSGSATQAKGFGKGQAFDVHVDELAQGQVLIASSAADEQSFESDTLQGAVFTFHWIVGLRGAADRDGDARVTLSEAYSYAYDQTLRNTLLSRSGPQHPSFRWEISGRRDLVLTFLKTTSALTLWAETSGHYLVFSESEKELIAETPVAAGQHRRLALPKGGYVVRKRALSNLRVARLFLDTGDDKVLYEHEMRDVPLLSLAQKGSLGKLGTSLAVGQYGSDFGPSGIFHVSAGPQWEKPHYLVGAALQLSRGQQKHGGLVTTTTGYAIDATALYGSHFGPVAVWGGPAVALEVLRQEHAGAPARTALVFRGGLAAQLDLTVTPHVTLFARGTGMGLLAKTVDESKARAHAAVSLLWWASYASGLRFMW